MLSILRGGELGFNRRGRVGSVFHMLSSLDELGRTGLTAIGETSGEAAAIHAHVEQLDPPCHDPPTACPACTAASSSSPGGAIPVILAGAL